MKPIQILVPIDFSDLSLSALPRAQSIAKLFEGTVTLFHTYMQIHELDGFYYMGDSSPETDLRRLERSLYERLEKISEKHLEEPYRAEPIVKIGNPARSITETGRDFDLIVMSSHGRTGFTRILLGSVCEKVLRTSLVPVLIVREESRLIPIERILLTTDFSENSIYAFESAVQFSEASGATIDLVHIVSLEQFDSLAAAEQDREKKETELDSFVKKYLGDVEKQVKTEVIYSEKSVHEEIARLAKVRDYNLVIMSTIGRTGLNYLVLGSTASSVMRHVKSAILSIRPVHVE